MCVKNSSGRGTPREFEFIIIIMIIGVVPLVMLLAHRMGKGV